METDAKLVSALWQVVAEHGWNGLTMARLAAASGVALTVIRQRCPSRLSLLRMHGQAVDQAVLEGGAPDPQSTARDRVFDVLMRRIDAMQPYRQGLLRLFDDLRCDPVLALLVLAEVPRSMAWMLEAAEVAPQGAVGMLRVKGLTGVWLATVRAWSQDESEDLGPTMAALDRALGQAERLGRTLGMQP